MSQSRAITQNDFQGRKVGGATFFAGGCNSGIAPQMLSEFQYRWGLNGVNRGGIFQTRPGFNDCGIVVEDAYTPQGMTTFRPLESKKTYLVVAIDGLIYYCIPPDFTFFQIPGIQFKQNAPIIYLKEAIKSVTQNPDGSLVQIDPVKVLMMQDGGLTRAAFWDGSTGRHLNPTPGVDETPMGSWMEWIGDRLWIINGNELLASDIADPLKFTEIDYLSEGLPFQLPDEGSGLRASEDQKILLAFTHNTTTAFQASIRKRQVWKDTIDFQKLLFPGIGCVAGRSIISQYGLLWWYSAGGLVSYNTAFQTYRDAKVIYNDREMARSKGNMSPILNLMCGGSFENYLFLSAPSGDIYNAQTWILDQSSIGAFEENSQASWNGVWTGIRPVEWAVGTFDDRQRCFVLSRDYIENGGSNIRVWEAFIDRTDSGNPIEVWFEGRLHYNQANREKIRFAELYFGEMKSDVLVEAYWKGLRGEWHKFLTKEVIATNGPIGTAYLGLIQNADLIQSFEKQTRYIFTMEVPESSPFTGIAENDNKDNIDRGFSILVNWKGQAALLGYRLFSDDYTDTPKGRVEENEQNEERIVFDTGDSLIIDL